MGNQCETKPQTLQLPAVQEDPLIKVMSLQYGKLSYSPFELFTNGSEYNLYELNKIFMEMVEAEFESFDFADKKESFGDLEKTFRRARYSPLYFKLAGIEKKKQKNKTEYYLMSKEQFDANWKKRYQAFMKPKGPKGKKNAKKEKAEKGNKQRQDKGTKQKIEEEEEVATYAQDDKNADQKEDKKQKKIHEENLRKYDFILLKALIKYVMHKDYDTCFREKVSLIKYVRILESDFNFRYMDEEKKASIFIYELSRLFPHIFFVQSYSQKLLRRLKKQANSCFSFYHSKDQLIILNQTVLKQQFKQVNLKQQILAMLNEQKRLQQPQQPQNKQQQPQPQQQKSQIDEFDNLFEDEQEKQKFKKIINQLFAISSQNYFLLSLNFSQEYQINQEQRDFLENYLEKLIELKNQHYTSKTMIIAGNINNQSISISEHFGYYPRDQNDITEFKITLPLAADPDAEADSSDDEGGLSKHKIISNKNIENESITLIDGNTIAFKKQNQDEDNDSDEENVLGEKQFEPDQEAEEEIYNFSKEATRYTFIPCEIHPFESYLLQTEINPKNKIEPPKDSDLGEGEGEGADQEEQ